MFPIWDLNYPPGPRTRDSPGRTVVTTDAPYQWCYGNDFGDAGRIMSRRIAPYHVVAYDFGIKRNILRILSDLECRMTVVPATTSAEDALALGPGGGGTAKSASAEHSAPSALVPNRIHIVGRSRCFQGPFPG